MTKQCKACGNDFQPHPKVPDQEYCSSPMCQRERRRRWQQEKRRHDSDYRDNDARQIKDWLSDNPDYWQRYRKINPGYAERNRNLQQARNKKQRDQRIANEDELPSLTTLSTQRNRGSPGNSRSTLRTAHQLRG
ncbi:MAG: hypothetical protein WCK07_22215 [Betaproteobacteria bacterium]